MKAPCRLLAGTLEILDDAQAGAELA